MISDFVSELILQYLNKRIGKPATVKEIVNYVNLHRPADIPEITRPSIADVCRQLADKGAVRAMINGRLANYYIQTKEQIQKEQQQKEKERMAQEKMQTIYKPDKKLLFAFQRAQEAKLQ